MNARTKVLLAAALAALGGLGARRLFLGDGFLYAGTLEATKVDLSARLSSTLQDVKVQEGDRVSKDQLVVRLLCDDVKVASDLANSNYDRSVKLFKTDGLSQEAMDQVRSRKQDMDVRMGWCSIRSPIDGTVLSRYHEPGELVTPGVKLLTLADVKDIWAFIYVPQPEIARLKPGQTLKAVLPELNKREFEGRILKIDDEAEFTPKNVQTRSERTRLVYGVKVGFKESNAEEILKPGMTIEVALPRE